MLGQNQKGPGDRDNNLDVLRAAAIVMVVVFHIAQRWPVPLPAITRFTQYGEFGVDLFFVLSGWLIGGLLWREQAVQGRVNISRFIARRALRTMPPYFAALAIYFIGVHHFKGLPFDLGYLIFAQNYYERIPYFLISWSLCVEEHFYLFLPLILLPIAQRVPRIPLLLPILALGPALFRALTWDQTNGAPFGFTTTATHFRSEGLLLGVWAAYLKQMEPSYWAGLKKFAPLLLAVALFGLVISVSLSDRGRYISFYTVVSVTFLFLLVAVVGEKSPRWLKSPVIFWAASTSYSVYLIHGIVLDAVFRGFDELSTISGLPFVIMVSLIAAGGYGFHRWIERPSLLLRDYFAPSGPGR